ncbi:hypothetical protein GUJ93_ZPchr0003g16654 [Zizania palustris]|uniref:Uncharacterized protein n=1 Tax=Zizania palustris TaxID=103762 RepID=A0A8J5VEK3_ZIZPA|nr:hypothetical protein GUJ93_ZPchr0003g16654 [Zizania palustris]
MVLVAPPSLSPLLAARSWFSSGFFSLLAVWEGGREGVGFGAWRGLLHPHGSGIYRVPADRRDQYWDFRKKAKTEGMLEDVLPC